MALRECLVPDRRNEAQEEIVADLHTCLEQLIQRSIEMESKIGVCMQRAVAHMQFSKADPTSSGKLREKARAKMYMEDKRRIQAEYDKAQRSIHMLQQQIDNILSSHTDMVIVDTMRQFNATAARLSLPNKVREIENLGEELAERQSEVSNFQEAMQDVSNACMMPGSGTDEGIVSDDLLMQELEAYMNGNDVKEEELKYEAVSLPSPPPPPMIINHINKSNIREKVPEDKSLYVQQPYCEHEVVSLPSPPPPMTNKSNIREMVPEDKPYCEPVQQMVMTGATRRKTESNALNF
jgi:hypothetical protein